MNKIWSEEEIQFLHDNYKLNGATYCAKALGRSQQSIFMKANRLGIKSETVPHKQKTHKDYEDRLFEQEIEIWPLESYITSQTPILHECIKGHQWKVQPHSVLRGIGCPKCSTNTFDLASPAILYYIKITCDNETYYKIGITNRTVARRFEDDRNKEIIVIKEIHYATGLEAKNEETRILKEHAQHRQNIPGFLKSKGNTELFEFDILGLDE